MAGLPLLGLTHATGDDSYSARLPMLSSACGRAC